MCGTNWWKSLTQLRNIKDETILNHQIAKQQLIYVLTTAIKNSILPDVLAHIILNFIITKELYKNANNKNLQFTLNTLSLSPIKQKYLTQGTKLWQANYKKCVGMEFKLKQDIIICGIELDFLFQGVQVYAVLSGYKKIKNKTDKSNQKQNKKYIHEFMYKLIPCDHRQRCLHKEDPMGGWRWTCNDPRFQSHKSTEMIFTEINSLNQGGLKLLHKNMIYKLGFIISDGFYCNKYIDLKRIKNENKNNIDNNIKCISYRWLNKNQLLGGKCTYFNDGLIDKDGSSNALKWMPNVRFITF